LEFDRLTRLGTLYDHQIVPLQQPVNQQKIIVQQPQVVIMSDPDPPFDEVLPETRLAIEAALQAGKKVIEIYRTDFKVSEKADRSPVTVADTASNAEISSVLSRSQIPILSEEGENRVESAGTKTWIIDPLDGTKEFVDKIGEFTIMIALVDNHSPVIGVILSPIDGSLYVAQRSKGAYKYSKGSWERLKVSSVRRTEDASAVLSRSHVLDEELDFVRHLNLRSYSRLGSSLKILALCSAAAEIYFTASRWIKQWDTCASNCLISEAGGKMTDMFGDDLRYSKGPLNHEKGIVATNGFVHDQVIERCEILRKKLFKAELYPPKSDNKLLRHE